MSETTQANVAAAPSLRLERHLEVREPATAVELLRGATPISGQRLKAAMIKGAVWFTRGRKTQRIRRAKRTLQVGDQLHLYYDERVLALVPDPPILIADERGYSVWNKPYGVLSQGSKWGDHCTVMRWAEQHLLPQRPGFVVHRLDRAANGLMLLAHEKRVAAALSRLFHERQIEKHYTAVVHGTPALVRLPHRLGEPLEGREAITQILEVEPDATGARSRVTVSIETGRKHQIRQHLAGLGHPVVGDRLYGNPLDREDLQLTAHRLAFRCPLTGVARAYVLDRPGELPSSSS